MAILGYKFLCTTLGTPLVFIYYTFICTDIARVSGVSAYSQSVYVLFRGLSSDLIAGSCEWAVSVTWRCSVLR